MRAIEPAEAGLLSAAPGGWPSCQAAPGPPIGPPIGPAAGLLLRRLGPPDLPAVERHLLALGPEDRQMRFLTRFGDAVVSAYAQRIDPCRGILIGALDGPEGALLGLSEAYPAERPGRVEVAVSVHPPHRRRGLGRALVARAVAVAFEAGAEATEFLFAPENQAITRLVASLGGRFGPGAGQAEIRRTAWRRPVA